MVPLESLINTLMENNLMADEEQLAILARILPVNIISQITYARWTKVGPF